MPKTAAKRKPIEEFNDPAELDPKHYKAEFENDTVRVLRIKFDAKEKSVMHDHPAGVGIFLTDQHVKFTYPDGSMKEVIVKAGQTKWVDAFTHLPENLSDKPFEMILVEIKE
jgi:uncharacterized RmlC-like cupin family protein